MMNKMNENRPGYKKTKVGWIPEDWDVKRLEIIGKYLTGLTYSPTDLTDEKGLLVLRSSNIKNSMLSFNDNVYVSIDISLEKVTKRDDILICVRNGSKNLIGKSALINGKGVGVAHGAFMTIVRSPYAKYIFYVFQTDIYFHQVYKNLGATINSINNSDLMKFRVPFPFFPEQKKIAAILSIWDKAIEKLEALIAAREKRKKGLMQQLLTGKIKDWKHIKTIKLFDYVSAKNHPCEVLLSVTQDRGVIPRTMLAGKVMSPQGSTASYKFIRKSDFVISLRSFQGGIEYSDYQGIISPAYTVLRPRVELDSDFYRYFFKTYLFINKYLNIAVIGIRDGKQINIPDFQSVKIPNPPIKQQAQISKIFLIIDKEITLRKKELEKLKEQKKGLMQVLLTGKIRVKV